MFDSPWLDVAIGVVFVWFVFSLSVSFVNELLTQLFATRSKQLWKALKQMLDGNVHPGNLVKSTFSTLFWADRPTDPDPANATSVYKKVYATQTVQALEVRTGSTTKTRISNIPAPVFAQAFFELANDAREAGQTFEAFMGGLPTPLRRQLQALRTGAVDEANELRARMESWFDAQMTRLSAIYRAQARVILVPLGIIFAIVGFGFGLRTDALALTTDLQHDTNYRAAVVAAASSAAQQDLEKAGCPEQVKDRSPADKVKCEIAGVSKVKDIDLVLSNDTPGSRANFSDRMEFLFPWKKHPRPLLGVLITGVAISLGSTFWFDVLKRLTGLRKGSS